MKNRDIKIIEKFLEHIEDVKDFVGNSNCAEFMSNKKDMMATAFAIAQIGELTMQISDEVKVILQEVDWRGIKGFRNWLIHNYEKVELPAFWDVIKNDLPELETRLKDFLKRKETF
ncbi:MAG: DUF86 domain-containing protein [Oscillospiraceae bacterium]|nr:DUF86 domain-containing protein [Oscillospiraceae bacterium]